MSSKRSEEMVPITARDLERFHRNAPAALMRRGQAYQLQEMWDGAQTILFGGVPIAGLFLWGWSASEMLLFLLAGLWVGIFCDCAKVIWLREEAEAFASVKYDDWHVWVVADAIRSGRNAAQSSHIRARWRPIAGVVVDFLLGGISTLLISILLASKDVIRVTDLTSRNVLIGFLVYFGFRIGHTLWEIVSVRSNPTEEVRPVQAAVGLRGTALFLLVFLTVMLTENDALEIDAARVTMLVVNGLIVLVGFINFIGPVFLRGETRWLRDYIRKHPTP